MYLMPKIAGVLDVMLTKGGVTSYGGWLRFVAGAALELVFSFLQGAVSTIRTTIFMIGLLFGKSVVWGGQSRDAQGLSWSTAAQNLWPQMLFGVIVCGALLVIEPAVLWWSLPLTAGYLLAVPFAVLTADPKRRERPAEARRVRHPRGFQGAGGGERGHGRCQRTMMKDSGQALSCWGLSPASTPRQAPEGAEAWIPVASTGMTPACDWHPSQ